MSLGERVDASRRINIREAGGLEGTEACGDALETESPHCRDSGMGARGQLGRSRMLSGTMEKAVDLRESESKKSFGLRVSDHSDELSQDDDVEISNMKIVDMEIMNMEIVDVKSFHIAAGIRDLGLARPGDGRHARDRR